MNKKILLIGGNGYIGSRLYEYFLSKNFDVTNVDICWYGKLYENTLVDDYDNLKKSFIEKYTHIILLAGHSTVGMCSDSLISCFDNNVTKFIKLIEKLNNNQIFIYSSTAAVYGSNDILVNETFPLSPAINFYDYTKICNEEIAKLYQDKQIIGLRFGSVGGFSKNFRGENLLNSISFSAFYNKKITISNPEKMRSILGIKDLCKGMEYLIKNDQIKNKVYNWSSINGKIIDFGKAIKTLTNCEIGIDDTYHTNYSFNCSSKLFEKDYNFKFTDTVESIYEDISSNLNNIVINVKRQKRN